MRSIFYRAKKYGMEVVGIKDGTLGLIQRPVNSIELNYEIVSGSLFREGGTFLGTTNKGDPFNFKGEDGKYSDVSDKIIEGYKFNDRSIS
jgi:ATP-dependent phosphofructokinase / diphosphate-dependent phosphofructokinase